MNRKPFIVGNWKMNVSRGKIIEMGRTLSKARHGNAEVIIACPSIYLEHAKTWLPIWASLAAQNCYKVNFGAFTGEISPSMLAECGVEWVILGHLERRVIFGENDCLVAEKVGFSLSNNLKVIVCVGETLQERELGKTFDVVCEQLKSIAAAVKTADRWKKVVIAYESFWSVSSGQKLTVAQAGEVHAVIRNWLATNVGDAIAETTRIIFGGSVTGDNCHDLIMQQDIDGFLVGAASLKPEFIKIVQCVAR